MTRDRREITARDSGDSYFSSCIVSGAGYRPSYVNVFENGSTMSNPSYPAHVRLDTTLSDGGAHLCGNQEFLHVPRMTKPEETESVQTYGLAEGGV